MKMILLMYLEDDDATVRRLLEKEGITGYSAMPLEGHGGGAPGWYGDVPTFRSRMAFAIVEPSRAEALLEAVSTCTGCADPTHPIHAVQVDVEKATASLASP